MKIVMEEKDVKNIYRPLVIGTGVFYSFNVSKRVLNFLLPPNRNIFWLMNNLVAGMVASCVYFELKDSCDKVDKMHEEEMKKNEEEDERVIHIDPES